LKIWQDQGNPCISVMTPSCRALASKDLTDGRVPGFINEITPWYLSERLRIANDPLGLDFFRFRCVLCLSLHRYGNPVDLYNAIVHGYVGHPFLPGTLGLIETPVNLPRKSLDEHISFLIGLFNQNHDPVKSCGPQFNSEVHRFNASVDWRCLAWHRMLGKLLMPPPMTPFSRLKWDHGKSRLIIMSPKDSSWLKSEQPVRHNHFYKDIDSTIYDWGGNVHLSANHDINWTLAFSYQNSDQLCLVSRSTSSTIRLPQIDYPSISHSSNV